MRKVLYILSEFKDQDIDWIVTSGSRKSVPKDDVLVRQGEPIDTLYIVLTGRFVVEARGGGVLAELGSGEIVGELSFLDSRPPNASVTATEGALVYGIAVPRLKSKLRTDTGFASRFYRALGVLLADRLRETVGQLAYGKQRHLDDDREESGEISPDLLDNMSLAASRFNAILQKLLSS